MCRAVSWVGCLRLRAHVGGVSVQWVLRLYAWIASISKNWSKKYTQQWVNLVNF